MPKRIVIISNGHGTRIGVGPVFSDEAAARLQAAAEGQGWTGEAVIPLLSNAEFTAGQTALASSDEEAGAAWRAGNPVRVVPRGTGR
jgi:hypothetical protein